MKKFLLTLVSVLLTMVVSLAADGDTFVQGDFEFTVTSESAHEVSVSAFTPKRTKYPVPSPSPQRLPMALLGTRSPQSTIVVLLIAVTRR